MGKLNLGVSKKQETIGASTAEQLTRVEPKEGGPGSGRHGKWGNKVNQEDKDAALDNIASVVKDKDWDKFNDDFDKSLANAKTVQVTSENAGSFYRGHSEDMDTNSQPFLKSTARGKDLEDPSIAISVDGKNYVLDGQHRLNTKLKAGKPAKVLVMDGSFLKKYGDFSSKFAAKTNNSKESQRGSSNKEAVSVRFKAQLRESTPAQGEPQGRRFRVTLLREGLGNLADCFYYTAAAIQSAVPVFEGKKFMLNHPSRSEEQDRPERSVKDISGYYENCAAEQDSDGRFNLRADLVMPMDPSFDRERALMLESIAYSQKHPDQDLIGLSINADGNSDQSNLQEFMQTMQIPESCKPKLLEALQRGITTIRPVHEITTAVSCDLVTEAGAGGRIDQLLEQEKTEMKVKSKEAKKEKESEEKKEADPMAQQKPDQADAPAPKEDAQDGDDDGDDQDADGQGGDHPDADQDEELIKQMLDKYIGEPDHDDEMKQAAKEAYQNAMEACGGDDKKAMEMAGNVMAMHKHMLKKEKGEPAGVDAPQMPAKDQSQEAEEKKEKKEGVKESNRLVALTAENARLKAELETLKLEKFVEKTLRESKLPMNATKRFKECIKDVKTEKEVTEKFNVFKEAFALGGEADGMGFIIHGEKENHNAKGGLDLSDCVES